METEKTLTILSDDDSFCDLIADFVSTEGWDWQITSYAEPKAPTDLLLFNAEEASFYPDEELTYLSHPNCVACHHRSAHELVELLQQWPNIDFFLNAHPERLFEQLRPILDVRFHGKQRSAIQRLSPEAIIRDRRITSYASHINYAEEICAQVLDMPRLAYFVEDIAACASELINNAVFKAPRDAKGLMKYIDQRKVQEIKLKEEEHILLSYGIDESYLAISVTDFSGSLHRDDIIAHLISGLSLEQISKERVHGLARMLAAANEVSFAITPQESTEVSLLFERQLLPQEREKQPRGLSLFHPDHG